MRRARGGAQPFRQPLGLAGRREVDRLTAAGLADRPMAEADLLLTGMTVEALESLMASIRAEGLVDVVDGEVRERPELFLAVEYMKLLRRQLEDLGAIPYEEPEEDGAAAEPRPSPEEPLAADEDEPRIEVVR